MMLVMTMMVRDEADIVGAMVQHHLDQGVDMMIVTDNGSVDGTTEILEKFAAGGRVDLRHDPVHHKQQQATVTRMAREAYTTYHADWVLNADADEFWICDNESQTLAEAFAGIPAALGAFDVHVTDMIGLPAMRGTGLQRLVYQDNRTTENLTSIGLFAHATHNAVHVGTADVAVAQGNHFVNIPSQGEPPADRAIGVRHFPWRSWEQYSTKVRNAGSAYSSQTELRPSPNHHGMRDYRRLLEGTLLASYILRHPSDDELDAGLASGEFVLDERIAHSVESAVPDVLFESEVVALERARGVVVNGWEGGKILANPELTAVLDRLAESEHARTVLAAQVSDRDERISVLEEHVRHLEREFEALHHRRVVRFVDSAAGLLHRR
jgi:hypothetical protein